MKTHKAEFYLGLFIWLLDLLVAYGMWFSADPDAGITHAFSIANIVYTASLYLLFLIGYILSYGFLIKQSTRLIRVSGLILSSFAVLGLAMFFFFGMVALLATLIIIQLVKYIDEKPAFITAVMVPFVGVFIDTLMGRGFEYPVIIIYGTFNILALFANFRLIAERNAKSESEHLVRELKATQLLLTATTKRDERLRIGRDLHDSLGHQLTALKLQLEVACHVNEREKTHHLQQAKAISNNLLHDVRATVSEFRNNEEFELGEALAKLTLGLPTVTVDLDIRLDETLIGARQIEIIFRCVQEAMTNIIKHSNATQCDIHLWTDNQFIILSIKDNGQNISQIQPGNGLTGMTERVVEINGNLDFYALEEGFNLLIKLPFNVAIQPH
jgi:signal transduction histidine kinase